ncbi:class I SAM-dependent methyltransferase [Shimia sp.]|uniref:class I SAM-dependent methyltransferase n=1 Tax=Shimia sp. TaxID=1954381 RepID=UPI003BAA42EF
MPNQSTFEDMEFKGWTDPKIARGYADGFATATRLTARHLAAAVVAGPDTHILDLCTGHGIVAAELLAARASVVALDFSEAMLALAKETAPSATFVQGNALEMTFADQSFDAVTVGFGVPHFPDPARGFAEIARVLRPGGRLAFSIWCGQGSAGALGWLFEAYGRLADTSIKLPDGPDAHQFTDHGLVRETLTTAGFEDITSQDVPSELLVKSPSDIFDVFDKGAVRAAVLLSGQSEDTRGAIRASLAERVQMLGRHEADGYHVQAPCVMVSATRC